MPDVSPGVVRLHSVARGTGRTLLFSHGWGATSYMFERSAEVLSSHFRVVTWDQRGHGGSDSPDDPDAYSVDTTMADMAALLDEHGTGSGVLVGHSLGGYLSLEFARRHPERVEALVLVGAGPGFRKDDARAEWNRFTARIADRAEERGMAALDRERDLHGDLHSSVDGLVRSARGVLPQDGSAVLDSLSSISVPTLVIVGANDAQFRASADHMAAKIPDARLVIVPDAGHSINVEQPEAFEAAVVSFLHGRLGS
ncbi:MAG: alpha/beta fold hydrolase [Acidimicrobiia bacterium]|nr:alpha/beta fold hydrolase [Acidimicrobiia bacterium]